MFYTFYAELKGGFCRVSCAEKEKLHFKKYDEWLAVKRSLLQKLELLNKIGNDSRESGETVYLGNDDMNEFIEVLLNNDVAFSIEDKHSAQIKHYEQFKFRKEE